MLIWILIIVAIFITGIFVYKLIFSKNNSYFNTNFSSDSASEKHIGLKNKAIKAIDVLPNVKTIKEKKEFNWLKLHQNINPTNDSEIQAKLTKLIRDEREHIIVDKFIYFTNLNPKFEILEILEEVENNSLSYKNILHKLGNK